MSYRLIVATTLVGAIAGFLAAQPPQGAGRRQEAADISRPRVPRL